MREGFQIAFAVQPFVQVNAKRPIRVWRYIPSDTSMHGLKINEIVAVLDQLFQSVLLSFSFIRFSAASSIALAGASAAASNRIFISGRSNAC